MNLLPHSSLFRVEVHLLLEDVLHNDVNKQAPDFLLLVEGYFAEGSITVDD